MTAPAQYDIGRISIKNGENTVNSRWEQAADSGVPFATGTRLEHQTSGAVSKCILHSITNQVLFYDYLAGATPQEHEQVEGASTTSWDSGVASGGGSDTLDVSGSPWTNDEHNDRWVVIRIGTSTEEWRKILDTTTSELTVTVNWSQNPSSGDPYDIRSARLVALGSFGLGTPIDWAAAGILDGEFFGISFEPYAIPITSVSANQLTLATNWAGVDYDAVNYYIHRGYTSRGYPTIRPNEAAAASLVTAALELIDADVVSLLALAQKQYHGMQVDVDVDQLITSHAAPSLVTFENELVDESNGRLVFVPGSSHISVGTGVSRVRVLWGLKTNVNQDYLVQVFINGAVSNPGYRARIFGNDQIAGVSPRITVASGDLITLVVQALGSTDFTIDNDDVSTFMEVEILEQT